MVRIQQVSLPVSPGFGSRSICAWDGFRDCREKGVDMEDLVGASVLWISRFEHDIISRHLELSILLGIRKSSSNLQGSYGLLSLASNGTLSLVSADSQQIDHWKVGRI